MLGCYETEIIGRGMVLGHLTVLAALKQPDRKVEARRTKLSFVIAVGGEIQNSCRWRGMAQGMDDGPIDCRIAPATPLVGWSSFVADHGDDKAMLDALGARFISGEPRDRGDCSRCEEGP